MKVICFDLDDTLYKEIDYLKSAYKEIAEYAAEHCHGCSDPVQILAIKAYKEMLSAYESGDNAFERLNAFLGLSLPISDYLTIYRQHKPNIELSEEVFETLSKLRELSLELREKRGDSSITVSDPLIDENVEIRLGLITDGRSLQQRNKIEALGLYRFFDDEDIIISEEFGSEKPSAANYEYFMKRYPDCRDFDYVGDNPKKDFVGANALGWNTICLIDDGRNIHKQDFSLPEGYLPKVKVSSMKEIITKIKET